MVITLENGTVIQISELVKAELRSSLEPIPVSFECEIKLNESYAPYLLEGKILKVGKEQVSVKIIHAGDTVAPWNNGENIAIRKIIALHANSCGIAEPLPRAVIRENVGLSEIYRSCGGKSAVSEDFLVPRFYMYKGDVPSFLIARICQEHGGLVRWLPDGDRLSFVRIYDLFSQEAVSVKPFEMDLTVKSGFVVSHELPCYYSTAPDGGIIVGAGGGRLSKMTFSPLKTQGQLNAMTNIVLNSKEIPCEFSPDIHAGMIIKVHSIKMVVLTVAHVYRMSDSGVGESLSVFWVGVRSAGNVN